MKIAQLNIKDFKRFTDLTIHQIPEAVRVVLVVGPNGSGKSSLFDAFLSWYKFKMGIGVTGPYDYFQKKDGNINDMFNKVIIDFHDFKVSFENQREVMGKFYFRTAYRNDADFTVAGISAQDDPTASHRLANFIQNDTVVQENYQRLVSATLKGVYDERNDNKSVSELRDELIGKIRKSLKNVFDDLNLSSIGDPLRDGSFYFEKGISKDFHYKNLSGGEKSAFDLILDLIIKSSYYPEAIICIDEPEAHMHTRLQAKLFEEIYKLIPEKSQLWINTHSLGILKKAKEIDSLYPNTVAFINFDNADFDSPVILTPSKIDKTIWEKIIEITLDDMSNLLAPQRVVFCEGDPAGKKNKNFDAGIYSKIFRNKYPDTLFVSMGSANEIENEDNITSKVMTDVLKGSDIIRIVDRDSRSDQEIDDLKAKRIKVLSKRHLESYLLDDELIKKLCVDTGNIDKIDEALSLKQEKIDLSISRGNMPDDIKSASGEIYVTLKKLLNLTRGGNSKDAFLRDTICPLITEDTLAFSVLENDIFGN